MKKYLFILITLFSIYHVPTHAADLVRTSKRELQGRLDHTDKALNYIRNEMQRLLELEQALQERLDALRAQ
jgi:hypothetical protein